MPTPPKPPIQSPVRTIAGDILIDATKRIIGRGSTPEDATAIARALNTQADLDDMLAKMNEPTPKDTPSNG